MSIFKNIFSKEKKETLDKGLEKSSSTFFNKLSKAIVGKSKVDEDVLDNLEFRFEINPERIAENMLNQNDLLG